jgi:hypothetical protein
MAEAPADVGPFHPGTDQTVKFVALAGKIPRPIVTQALTGTMSSVLLSYCFYCECVVSFEPKSLHEYLTDWLSSLVLSIRAALSMPLLSDDERAEADRRIDPDFNGWVHNDPMVTRNAASRYYDRTPGYFTGSGLGSMEIGSADD